MLRTWGSTAKPKEENLSINPAKARAEYLKEAAMVYASAPGWCREHWEQDPGDFEEGEILSNASERMRWWLMPHEAVAHMEAQAEQII